MSEDNEVIAVLTASLGRRIIGIGALWGLAVLVFYIAVATPPALGWQVFLFAAGGGAIYLAEKMRKATSVHLELTRHELRDSTGERLALVDEMVSTDRSTFAFKPSSGFLLTLTQSGPVVWRPGMWWQIGRRIGVGGMTSAGQAKAMADIISAMVTERTDAS